MSKEKAYNFGSETEAAAAAGPVAAAAACGASQAARTVNWRDRIQN